MVESPRDPDPNAPQNPPASVLNKRVRRSALWTYLAPLLVFFAGVAVALVYWPSSPSGRGRDVVEPRAEGTSGTERERSRADTPGGQNPDRTPSRPRDELEDRTGRVITELGGIYENNSRDVVGRRVELSDIDVERVESPTLFWIRDGSVRAAVSVPAGGARVQAGQSVNIAGAVERTRDGVRIRASRVTPSH